MATKTPAKKVSTSKTAAPKKPAATTNRAAAAKKGAAKTSLPKSTAPSTKAAQAERAAVKGSEKASAEKSLNYFALRPKDSSPENAQVVIIPCAYDPGNSGTESGPRAILEASQYVEHFDEELWTQPYKIGIHTQKEIQLAPVTADSADPFGEIYEAVKPIVEFGKFPVVIGGEHSISLGAVRACAERYQDLSVLQITAHADLRKSQQGNPFAHSTIGFQLYKSGMPQPSITQVGVRNISAEEVAWMEHEKPNINIYWARHQEKWNVQEIVSTLSDNVYLSIDVDGLDSSIMPSTATPEPGGILWYQLIELIKVACVKRNVVAADIVELAPISGMRAPDFLCAKLLYKIIGYRFALDLGVTKKYL